MLLLLPPSEGKAAAPRRGKPLDLGTLSWPELTVAREQVLVALDQLAHDDPARARAALGISERMDAELERDRQLRTSPTLTVAALYTGVLYDALDLPGLAPTARRWATRNVVVLSALFGALRLGDRVPTYRLAACARLPGIGPLVPFWRQHLDAVLAPAAGRDLIVDLRSTDYAAMWRPRGELSARTVAVHVRRDGVVASHDAKHTRGLVARRLCEAGERLRRPEQLVEVLAPAFKVRLEAAGPAWRLEVVL